MNFEIEYRLVMNSVRACVYSLGFIVFEEEKRSEEDGFLKTDCVGKENEPTYFGWLLTLLR